MLQFENIYYLTYNVLYIQDVYEWRQHHMIHQLPIPVVEEGKPAPPAATRPLQKIVSEHKDVVKIVILLSSIISSSKVDAIKVLDNMKDFQELWIEVMFCHTLENYS